MKLELVTLEGVKYSEEAYEVVLPTASGQITVLPNHEPLLSVLVPGVVTVRKAKGDADTHLEHFATFGGVLEVSGDAVRVLVDEAESGDVSEQEELAAQQAAKKLLAEAKDQVELDKAQALVDRSAVRLQVAQLRRRHRR